MAYNKKVLSKAVSELGKAKAPAKPKDITVDPMGYWNPANQGKPVRIPGQGNPKGVDITMHKVNQPIWAQPNVGPGAMMYPEDNRHFSGASYVDETQIGRKGGTLKSKKYSKSISATNKLFAKNKLFKNKKSKIFDPNAEFKKGGSKLGPINLNPNPLSHYELNYGYNLPTEQDGGVRGNPWLYTNMQENEGRDPGQVIGLGADFQHKSGLHGSTNVELPFFNKNATGNLYSELGYNKRFKNFDADATLKNYTEPGSKFNPSFTTGIGYNKNFGDHFGFNAGVNNTMVPGKLKNLELQAGLTYNFQEGGENNYADYEDLELTDEEIQAYRDGGYVVEEISEYEEGGALDIYQKKGEVKTFKRDIRDQDAQSNTGWGTAPVQKKKVQPTVKQKQAQKSFDKNFKVTDKSKYEKTEDKIVTEQQKLKDWAKETGRTITDEDLKSVADQQWSFAGVGPQKQPDMMQATPEQSNSSRAWEYITNPMTALKYEISGGGYENMPHHINEMRMAGINPDENNLVGNMLNGLNLFDAGDKVVRNTSRGNYGEAALEAMRFIPGGGLLDDAARLGLKPGVKALGKTFNTTKGKLAKFIPERAPGTPSTGGGNLNAGISPELIQGAIGPKNKVIANIADKSYMPFLNKAMNRISPLNWVPGYGKKLEGAIKPLGNVIGNSIENGKLVESKSLFNKAKGLVKKGEDADLTTKMGKTNASDIYSAKIDGSVDGSKIGLGSANQQGFIGRNFRKGNASYPIQNNWGTGVKQVPLTDAGVSLNRRLPFSNRYVPIDKEKLMNNKFQWATTGAGLQKVGEKFGAAALTTGIGAGALAGATYDPMSYVKDQDVADQIRLENGNPNDYVDIPTRTDAIMKGATDAMGAPSEYLKEGFLPNIIGSTGEAIKGNLKQGGTIEEVWEDELDEHTIALLRKAGYTVEELD